MMVVVTTVQVQKVVMIKPGRMMRVRVRQQWGIDAWNVAWVLVSERTKARGATTHLYHMRVHGGEEGGSGRRFKVPNR